MKKVTVTYRMQNKRESAETCVDLLVTQQNYNAILDIGGATAQSKDHKATAMCEIRGILGKLALLQGYITCTSFVVTATKE